MASTSTSKASIPQLQRRNDSIYIFHEPPNRPTMEVIFVHDIHWSEHKEPHVETWMSSSSPSICWPKDWLSTKFPEARIISVCYDAAIRKTNTAGRMDLFRIAENLCQDILGIYAKNCPVFLVGHGLGGLVIKKVIQSMKRDGLSSFLENVEGVFFYNSPFQGTRLADYLKFFPQGSPLLEIIKTLSAEASRLNEWFREWRRGRCRTTAISAGLPTKVASGYGPSWSFEVVEESSARYDIDHFYTSASDHFCICKPPDQIDNRFSMLTKFLDQERLPRDNALPMQIMDSAATSSCTVLLKSILSQVAKVKQGQGVSQCIYLKREDLDKIRLFPKMETRLMDGLKKAGLAQTRVFAFVELWSPSEDGDKPDH